MFITLEGIDRSGKTTQAGLLAEALGPETVLLREPGGTELAERIRPLLTGPDSGPGPRAELLLFCAARADLCERVIAPALATGHDVVCDRFSDSSVAYQGIARGLGAAEVERLCEWASGGLVPDLTLLLRIDPARAAAREGSSDRFEAEGEGLQQRVARAYDELAHRHAERMVVLDAAEGIEAVHRRALAAVGERRPRRGPGDG